jgi:hypothetical protein
MVRVWWFVAIQPSMALVSFSFDSLIFVSSLTYQSSPEIQAGSRLRLGATYYMHVAPKAT